MLLQDSLSAARPADPAWTRLQGVLAQLQKYRLVVEHTSNMVVITDAHKRIEYVNPAYTEVTGWALDDVRGLKPGGLLQGPGTNPQTVRQISAALAQGQAIKDVELINYNRRGEPYWVSLCIQPIHDEQGELTHFVAIQSDVTARRQARDALESSERRLAEAQSVARMASFECDLVSDVMFWSPDAGAMLGLPPEALPACYLDHVRAVHEDDRDRLLDAHWGMAADLRPYEIEYRIGGGTSPIRWIRERGHHLPADDRAPQRLSGLLLDITDTRLAHDRVEYLARHDTLTGLINREQLKSVLRAQLLEAHEAQTTLAVLFVDLDRFKTINDSLGHPVGDEVLKEVARRLRETVRTTDVVCRLGGDDFVLLLAGVEDPCVVARLGSKILSRIAMPIAHEGRDLQITASMGISLYPQDGGTADDLMRHADAAMYQAKDRGRNTLSHYCAQTNARSAQRFEIESRLRHALARDELELHYQPQFEARNGALVGFEALLRWHPREGASVGPDLFIPVAEECGLIGAMGAWVLEQACGQWRLWRDQMGVSVRMAVNVSAHQLRGDHDLVAEGVETATQQAYLTEQGCDLMQGYLLGRPVPAALAAALITQRTGGQR
jgi:diguanylate cyclase (GGDEF)-like protein/PAS domain S-box-containing protein